MNPILAEAFSAHAFPGTVATAQDLGLTLNNCSFFSRIPAVSRPEASSGILVGRPSTDQPQIAAVTTNPNDPIVLFNMAPEMNTDHLPRPHPDNISGMPSLLRRALFFGQGLTMPPTTKPNPTRRTSLVHKALKLATRQTAFVSKDERTLHVWEQLSTIMFRQTGALALTQANLIPQASAFWLNIVKYVHEQRKHSLDVEGKENSLQEILQQAKLYFSAFRSRDPAGYEEFRSLVSRLGIEELVG